MSTFERPLLRARIDQLLDDPGPALICLRGPSGSGKSWLVRNGLGGRRAWAVHGTIGGSQLHRAAFVDGWRRLDPDALAPEAGAPWGTLLTRWLDDAEADRRPRVLALDEVHHLVAASPDLPQALGRAWARARAHGLPAYMVLCSAHDAVFERLFAPGGGLAGVDPHTIHVGPTSIAELAAHLPDWSPRDRLMVRACLGPWVRALRHLEPDLRLATNLQKIVIDPDGPLHNAPPLALERQVQKPDRYAGVLRALANGADDWAAIRSANPVFTSGNQLAPYLATLQELGWVQSARSLDAPLRSRRRRYRLVDPSVAYWYRVVEPELALMLVGESPARIWRDRLGVATERHVESQLPEECRTLLIQQGDTVFGARAREMGGLWGEGYDLPVAGTLGNGAAVYGRCVWSRMATVADADGLTRQMKATRFGFGREARMRVLFTGAGATEPLIRRAALDDLLTLVPLDTLF